MMNPRVTEECAVKKSRFTEEQIADALKQAELGTPVEGVCRKLRDFGRHILHLAQKIRRADPVGAAATQTTRRGKRQTQTAGGGFVVG
jgi:hypothetical protein